MTKEALLKNIFQWGVLATIAVMALPDPAIAASVGDSFSQLKRDDVKQFPPLVNAIAYVIGAVLGISGALKLKAHAENPNQEKLAPGIARLLAGGAVAALPVVVQTAYQTLHIGGTISYKTFNAIT